MGNKVCCEQNRHSDSKIEGHTIGQITINKEFPHSDKKQTPVHAQPTYDQIIVLPHVSPIVQEKFKEKEIHDIFKKQLENDHEYKTKKYGGDTYRGQLDESGIKPSGFGKMYKSDGSVYLGYFNHGKAEGKGAYIFNNGAYFNGEFRNNLAETQNGYYKANELSYRGGVKNNSFHGHATEIGNGYVFKGEYENGHRSKGVLEWTKGDEKYKYIGSFNQNNKFHGKGQLNEPQGRYEGDFQNGEKHGEGKYDSENGTKYEGSYNKGVRSGSGTIYNVDSSIAYKGQMKNGIPHGKGSVFKGNKQIEAIWEEGIDVTQLPDKTA